MRMQRMRRQVMEHNIYRWAANILGDLRELRIDKNEDGGMNPVVMPPVSIVSGEHRRLA